MFDLACKRSDFGSRDEPSGLPIAGDPRNQAKESKPEKSSRRQERCPPLVNTAISGEAGVYPAEGCVGVF
jgi:hypothetical protein